jgi:hypothetical protein
MNYDKVTIIRICQLKAGDLFMLNGAWRIVLKIEDGDLFYQTFHAVQKVTYTTTCKFKTIRTG